MNTSSTLPANNDMKISPLHGLLGPCLRGAVVVAFITGIAYPLAITGVAQLLLPTQASGSLIQQGNTVVGSRLIGQNFSEARYFHPRPSSTLAADPADSSKSVASPYNAGASAGSNQGPTNVTLVEAVQHRVKDYRASTGLPADASVPVDAVTASASGLDPHISVANAQLQMERVAKARYLPLAQVQSLLAKHTEGRLLGLLGEPRVNVLLLNLALDVQMPQDTTGAEASPVNNGGEHHVQ